MRPPWPWPGAGTPLGLIDRDATALVELVQELKSEGATVAHAAVDVTDRHALIRAVADIAAALGPIDVLVACAGIGSLTLVPQLETMTLGQTLDVNLVGVAQSIEAVLPGMIARGRGHIVGVASVAGYRGFPWMISYSASKAALIAYLEALRPGPAPPRCDGDDGLSRVCANTDEHGHPLPASRQDDRARRGGSPPAPRDRPPARATVSSPGT